MKKRYIALLKRVKAFFGIRSKADDFDKLLKEVWGRINQFSISSLLV